MPIYGVSTREHVEPRFKSLGKLRKGSPKKNGRFGDDLDHFRFTSEDPVVAQAFYQAYGEQPSELVVFLPFDRMERNFSSWRELYGQNGLVRVRCDGENWVDWIEGPRHRHGRRPCTKEFLDPENRCPQCPLQPVGRLQVILPELWKAGYIGLATLETHSWNDIAHLSSKLVQYEPLTGKPFNLWREMTTIGAPNEKTNKRMAVTKPLVRIELTDERLVYELQAAQRRSLAQVQAPALPSGEPVTDVELALWEPEPGPSHHEPEPEEPPPGQDPAPELPADAQGSQSANGARPWDAGQVIAEIQRINGGKDQRKGAASDAQKGLVASKLEECFAGDDDARAKRHTVLNAVFGFDSVKLLSRAQASALLQWLLVGGQDDSGDYPLHPSAPAEAAAIVRAALIDAGQMELEIEAILAGP